MFIERRAAAVAAANRRLFSGYLPSSSIKLGDLLAEPSLVWLDTDKDGRLSKVEWLAAAKSVFAESEKDETGLTDERG